MNSVYVFIDLVKRDFKTQYKGSYFGWTLLFLQPLLFAIVLWLVVSLGIRGNMLLSDTSTLYWIIAGYAPWMFFSGVANECTNVFREYSFIVRRPDSQTGQLPLIKVGAALPVHAFMVMCALVIQVILGEPISMKVVGLIALLPLLGAFSYSVGLIFGSSMLFAKDTRRVSQMLVQWGFFLTPVIWDARLIPESLNWILSANPLVSIIEGYRYCLISSYVPAIGANGIIINLSLIFTASLAASFLHRRLQGHYSEML